MGHKPVLAASAIESLIWDPDGLYVDGTIGCGGHARLILERLSPRGFLLGFDWDAAMLDMAAEALGAATGRFRLYQESFARIGDRLAEEGRRAHGILIDLGLNSVALDDSGRGFRHSAPEAPLDMRMDRSRPGTAGDLLNEASEDELTRIFRDLGEARRSRVAARAIVHARAGRPLLTSGDLVRTLERARAVPGGPAELSRIFQALRLEVNRELDELDHLVANVSDWLVAGGRLVVIAYESLSDRRVKSLQRSSGETGGEARFRKLTAHVLRPDRDEIRDNPRARSAKMRVMERKD
jgi:16S rRNA (cytosine1402-N4)-methyltransferase